MNTKLRKLNVTYLRPLKGTQGSINIQVEAYQMPNEQPEEASLMLSIDPFKVKWVQREAFIDELQQLIQRYSK